MTDKLLNIIFGSASTATLVFVSTVLWFSDTDSSSTYFYAVRAVLFCCLPFVALKGIELLLNRLNYFNKENNHAG